MDVRSLNMILAAWPYFVFLTRNDRNGTQPIRMWLTSVDETPDGRLILKTCDVHNPSNSLRLGQVGVGEEVFVTIDESRSESRTFSLRDAGWTVSNFNLPIPA
jgi:hypothetical protein